MTLSCIIVDDDQHSIEQLTEFIGLIPNLKVINSYNCAATALKDISSLDKPLDFLFTDVEMPQISGIELAKRVMNKVNNLVLVSGHLRYAIDGYDIKAKGFLEKPFSFKKFEHMVNHICEEKNSYIHVKQGKTTERISIHNVLAFEGASNYIKIHTDKKLYISYFKLGDIEQELLGNPNFIRINRSFIIAKDQIEKITGREIHLKNGIKSKIGDTYKGDFYSFLKKTISFLDS